MSAFVVQFSCYWQHLPFYDHIKLFTEDFYFELNLRNPFIYYNYIVNSCWMD